MRKYMQEMFYNNNNINNNINMWAARASVVPPLLDGTA